MMVIHPHWQSTDVSPVRIRISHVPVSRRPAAILGISLALLLGILLLQNVHTLVGQLTESSSSIRITASGLEPASITLPPGALITWKNGDVKPHILSSDTLRTTDGLLYSTAIFPEEEFRATIAEEGSLGEHVYVSLTDSRITGTVHVEQPPTLPKNPLVAKVRSTTSLPNTLPVTAPSPSRSSPRPKPFRHPDTGVPLGISSLTALALVLLLTRRILRSPHAHVIRP